MERQNSGINIIGSSIEHVVMPKAFLRDKKLSLKAKGLMAYLLSYEDDTHIDTVKDDNLMNEEIEIIAQELLDNNYIALQDHGIYLLSGEKYGRY